MPVAIAEYTAINTAIAARKASLPDQVAKGMADIFLALDTYREHLPSVVVDGGPTIVQDSNVINAAAQSKVIDLIHLLEALKSEIDFYHQLIDAATT